MESTYILHITRYGSLGSILCDFTWASRQTKWHSSFSQRLFSFPLLIIASAAKELFAGQTSEVLNQAKEKDKTDLWILLLMGILVLLNNIPHNIPFFFFGKDITHSPALHDCSPCRPQAPQPADCGASAGHWGSSISQPWEPLPWFT